MAKDQTLCMWTFGVKELLHNLCSMQISKWRLRRRKRNRKREARREEARISHKFSCQLHLLSLRAKIASLECSIQHLPDSHHDYDPNLQLESSTLQLYTPTTIFLRDKVKSHQ
mmetsp:Transcript_19237/g.32453  ORF Transcript_19237/g.32453 Transcript_19237/m.32453 type:complete len:113 (+) Transcript_19237:77-415(+)